LLIIEFGNNGITKDGIIIVFSQPYTFLILSVAFASSTLYLWIKNLKSEVQNESDKKNKISIGMIIYILVLFPVIGFYLSKKECLETYQTNNCISTCSRVVPVIYIFSAIIVLIYIYFQLKDFYEIERLTKSSKTNVTMKVDEQIKKLNNEL
jgi:heme/copper-type cytochrome/quinol oxidase subunit 2